MLNRGMLQLLLLLPLVAGLRVDAGGPGGAAFIGYMQGMYAPDFPMPADAVTVELWSKLLPVSGRYSGVPTRVRPSHPAGGNRSFFFSTRVEYCFGLRGLEEGPI